MRWSRIAGLRNRHCNLLIFVLLIVFRFQVRQAKQIIGSKTVTDALPLRLLCVAATNMLAEIGNVLLPNLVGLRKAGMFATVVKEG